MRLRRRATSTGDDWRPITATQRAEVLRRIDAIPTDATSAHPAIDALIAYLRSERLAVADHRIRIAESPADLAKAMNTVRDWFSGLKATDRPSPGGRTSARARPDS